MNHRPDGTAYGRPRSIPYATGWERSHPKTITTFRSGHATDVLLDRNLSNPRQRPASCGESASGRAAWTEERRERSDQSDEGRRRIKRPEARASAASTRNSARKELARLERTISQLERREAALHEELAAHATDYPRLAELDVQLRSVSAEREAAETKWLELAEHAG
jgi:hypothetical protein